MKTLLKLIVTAIIANAGWHVADAWLNFFKFKDAVTQASQFGGGMSMAQLRGRVMEIATQYSVPIADENVTIRRDDRVEQHTFIDGTYVQPLELFPRVAYPWTFQMHVDTFTTGPARLDGR